MKPDVTEARLPVPAVCSRALGMKHSKVGQLKDWQWHWGLWKQGILQVCKRKWGSPEDSEVVMGPSITQHRALV